jgi:O-antigen ligase
MRLLWHPYLDPARVRADLARAAADDPFGDRVHTWLAAAWCFLLAFPTSVVEIASIPLLVFFALRTPKIWRTWGSFAVQPATLAIGAWIAWQALSLAWSGDRPQGLQELAANRWIWTLWVLWPVMHRRPLLIAALAAGFLCGNLSQLGHSIGKVLGWGWLTWPRLENRNSGWWDPVVGGSLLAGALGLHLPAAVMGRGRERLIGVAGAAITLVAIFATGTRGAWIAAAGLVVASLLSGAVVLVRRGGGASSPRKMVIAAAAAVVFLELGAVLLKDTIVARYNQGRAEVAAALDRGDYSSDTGKRLLMWQAAAEAIKARPLTGVGAGGYRPWSLEHVRVNDRPLPPEAIHVHAHSAPLHITATTGLPGLALAGIVVALALYGAFAGLRPEELGTYAAGPGFAIMGLMLAGLFDPVHLNAQTGAFLATLMALCLLSRPAAAAAAVESPLSSFPGAHAWPGSAPSAASRSTASRASPSRRTSATPRSGPSS